MINGFYTQTSGARTFLSDRLEPCFWVGRPRRRQLRNRPNGFQNFDEVLFIEPKGVTESLIRFNYFSKPLI